MPWAAEHKSTCAVSAPAVFRQCQRRHPRRTHPQRLSVLLCRRRTRGVVRAATRHLAHSTAIPSGDVFMLLICAQLRVPYPAHHLAWQPSGREITCHLRTAPGAPHNLDAIASGQASWRVPKGPVRLSSRRDSGCSGQTKGSTAQWAQSEWGDGAGTAGGCRGVGGHPPPSAGAGSS